MSSMGIWKQKLGRLGIFLLVAIIINHVLLSFFHISIEQLGFGNLILFHFGTFGVLLFVWFEVLKRGL